ncbi:MAG: deoxyribodipyrimidine photo-lyase [Pseudomonadota bacterium]
MADTSLDTPAIMWFRQDLRLEDNPALVSAVDSGKPLILLYVLDETSPDVRPMGSAQKWWLHHSLTSLSNTLNHFGNKLILSRGPAQQVIETIVKETGADAIFWNRRYGAGEQAVDAAIKSNFPGQAASRAGLLMHEPSAVRTGSGNPYKVYTPFWKSFKADHQPRKPLAKPNEIKSVNPLPNSDRLEDWNLLPTQPDWSGGIDDAWVPGEAGAAKNLERFKGGLVNTYGKDRDLPGPDRTSRMSPHLRFGEISPHQIWHAIAPNGTSAISDDIETYLKELVWREFAYHLLQEWPDLHNTNFNAKFDAFPWDDNETLLEAWRRGRTGYPIVDAGMRQLYQTGWMHNRVRMIVGSFLVKHLLQDWRHGERWFWDTLVDGDPASNPAQWQWVAGTGADAAPYFRIFNPIMQAEKFDAKGTYIKRYVPELADLPAQYLAAPWDAPLGELRAAGVKLGETYPLPIVEHKQARERALDALNTMKEQQVA